MQKKKVLVVDDEQSITRLLKFALEKTGVYEVVCENRGAQAVAAARLSRPNLVILDVNLPDMDGGAISAALRSDPELRSIPIVFLTGNVADEEVDAGLTIGGRPALGKPVNMEKLLQCVEKLLS